jgi:hypothetical protein
MTPDQRRARRRGRIVAWILLVVMGLSTIALNVDHAVTTGKLSDLLAVLVALVPVIAYVGLSEIVAVFRGAVLQTVTVVSMVLGMALSMSAVASVVRPEAGPYLCWLFGAVLDLPVVIALYVIMNEPADGRDAKAAPARKPARPAAPRPAAPVPAQAYAPAPAANEPAPAGQGQMALPVAPAASRAMGHRPAASATNDEAAESGDSTGSFAERAAEHENARNRYRESVIAGSALSDRALAREFGRSRNWGAKRIEEVQNDTQLAEAQ